MNIKRFLTLLAVLAMVGAYAVMAEVVPGDVSGSPVTAQAIVIDDLSLPGSVSVDPGGANFASNIEESATTLNGTLTSNAFGSDTDNIVVVLDANTSNITIVTLTWWSPEVSTHLIEPQLVVAYDASGAIEADTGLASREYAPSSITVTMTILDGVETAYGQQSLTSAASNMNGDRIMPQRLIGEHFAAAFPNDDGTATQRLRSHLETNSEVTMTASLNRPSGGGTAIPAQLVGNHGYTSG